ncbi:MAG: glycosyltransferase family 4 protein, partial [Pseudomonadota bacterium]
RITNSGDRDGLPNVLMEAASQGVPAVATKVSAIPEFIDDGITGRLVEPNDPAAFAAVVAELITDKSRRDDMGAAVLRRVETEFTFDHCLSPLLKLMAGCRPTAPEPLNDVPLATAVNQAEPTPAE